MSTDVLNISDLDGRSRSVKRVTALARDFILALGGNPPPHKVILIRSAAELTAIAEQTRAAHLAGHAVTLNDVVRAENAMARAIRALDIPDTAAAKPGLSALDRIRAKYAVPAVASDGATAPAEAAT
jgi:hypothetical protein